MNCKSRGKEDQKKERAGRLAGVGLRCGCGAYRAWAWAEAGVCGQGRRWSCVGRSCGWIRQDEVPDP